MFSDSERYILSCGYFRIIQWKDDSVEIVSLNTGHYWILMKFDKEGYPGLVLYHSHDKRRRYHVHFCYKEQDIVPAVSEIMNHDRYVRKKFRLRHKITMVSNRELLSAIKSQ